MKTSIKILLGLLLTIFMIPTIFLMAFGYKIKKAGYKPYDEAAMWKRVDIGPGRFIKISAPDKEVLECKLVLSDKPHYMVWPHGTGGDDSVAIDMKNDTLFISYVDIKSNDNDNRYRKSVEIFVSDWQQLQADGASIVIDSSFGNQYSEKHISLNNSLLHFGKDADGEENDNDENNPEVIAADSAHPFINNLQLNAFNSKLVLNGNYSIKNISLDFTNGELIIKRGAYVNAVTGSISTGSKLRLDGLSLGKMKELQVK
ncbi:MAG: hypothetical protein V4717_02050 [Bacteroidota bacterium]